MPTNFRRWTALLLPRDSMAPRLGHALSAAGAGLLVVAAVVAWLGGSRLSLGPLDLSVASPFRPAGQGLALLLAGEALSMSTTRHARLRFLGLLGAFVTSLVLESPTRIVGDGHEYVAMAWNMAQGRPPSLLPQELRQVEALLPPRIGGYRLWAAELVSADGRQDFYHSWLYPLTAVPLVRAALWYGTSIIPAFAALNVALLVVAAYFSWERHGPRVTLLVLGGAVLWWVDKAHTEVFLVSLLVAAVSLLESHPGWSLVLQGAVALQNPTLAVLLLGSVVWLIHFDRMRGRGARFGLAVALLLMGLGPAYYTWRIGYPSPLSTTVVPHWPGLAELLAMLADTNLGLVFAWPALGTALLAALAALAHRSSRVLMREHPLAVALLAGAALAVLVAGTQPGNLNSGGTRSLSRYALWLVPLAVPVLARFERDVPWGRAFLAAMAAGSLVTSLGDYHPRMRERYVTPTPLAEWLWRHYPRAAAPLPEVFAERTAHFEGPGIVPVATEGCEKALLVGDGTAVGAWPLWCRPQAVPEECSVPGVYCYAHTTRAPFSFSRAPRQPGFDGLRPYAWYWTGSPDEALVRFLAGIPWSKLWLPDPRDTEALFAGRRGLGRFQARINREVLLVWIERPRSPASITLHPLPDHRAVLIDPLRAQVLDSVVLDPSQPTTVVVPYFAPLLLAVTPAALVPSAGFAPTPGP